MQVGGRRFLLPEPQKITDGFCIVEKRIEKVLLMQAMTAKRIEKSPTYAGHDAVLH